MRIIIKQLTAGNNKLSLYYEAVEENNEIVKEFSVCLNYNIKKNGEHDFYHEEYQKLSDSLVAYDKIQELLTEMICR